MHSLVRQDLQDFLFSYKEPISTSEQVNTPPAALIDSKLSHQIRKSVNEKNATQRLTAAKTKPVSFAVRCNTTFNGLLEHEIPVPGMAASFEKGQFLHVYEIFDANWWIARLVISASNRKTRRGQLGFVPSPLRLQQWRVVVPREEKPRRSRRAWSLLRSKTSSKKDEHQSAESEDVPPYEVVPCMRPICFVGPSLKGFQITDYLHRALVDAMVQHFRERLTIIPLTIPTSSPLFDMAKLSSTEIERIFEDSKEMKLILLESESINHPRQFSRSTLAPILIYLKISDIKVFQQLTKIQGITRKDAKRQLIFAENLARCPDCLFDLVVEDNTLAAATSRVLNFLENYWHATHLIN